jgi:outer membrane receptor protein involved in Fe transport
MKKILLTLVLIFPITLSFSQTSRITGKVFDKEFQEPLPFANIVIGQMDGTVTDFDGVYSVELEAGVYSIRFSFVGFNTITVENIELAKGEVKEIDIYLESAAQQFEEVVVTAETLKNNEQSVLQVQKKSANLLDGLSAQNIKSTGVSDLANAIKTVPGVSVQGGKYVYVRGLGDRYTKTTINGIDIPGLDPDRNTIQLDIFPTNIIDQIIVLKSASADQPADFTGGIVDIVTKDIPSSKQFGFSISSSYNPNMNLADDFRVQEKSNTDIFGFDAGDRTSPISRSRVIPSPTGSQSGRVELSNLTKKFNNTFASIQESSGMDLSLNVNYGNQFELGANKLGLISSLSYTNAFTHYDNFESNIFQRDNLRTNDELRKRQGRLGLSSEHNVQLNGLFGLSFKTKRSKYKYNFLGIQNGISNSILMEEERIIGADALFEQTGNFYTQKRLLNNLISGTHFNSDGSLKVEWKVSNTQNQNHEKDFRTSAFDIQDDIYNLDLTATGPPTRFWRILDESGNVGKLDLTKDYLIKGKKAKLKAGLYYSQKERDYYIENYIFDYREVTGRIPGIENGNPYMWLDTPNILDPLIGEGTYFYNASSKLDEFSADQTISAAYISNELEMIENLRMILGFRYEIYKQNYEGFNRNTSTLEINPYKEDVIDESKLYPSLNLIYKLNEEANLRFGYSETVARPSFKELSNASIYDPLTTTFFFGNLDLQPSYINNFDLRFEKFYTNGDMLAFSGFYKKVKDPIEVVLYSEIVDDTFQAKNLLDADVYGIEFEIRKTILENLKFRTNASYIYSNEKMADSEYQGRLNNAREGETIEDSRPLQGQSPYLINSSLEYFTEKLKANLNYNVQGKALEVVGNGSIPDVYTMPFNSLNLNIIRYGGENKNIEFRFRVNNILDDTRRSEFIASGANEKYYFRKLDIGRRFTLGVGFKF